MRKVAVFVEGLTEQEFVVDVLLALAGKRGIDIELCKQVNGRLTNRTVRTTAASPQHFVLVADCSNDDQVLSQIRDQHQSLSAAGFSSIVGLRDAYPSIARNDIERLKKRVSNYLPKGGAVASLHIAVMEVEAWFLGERSHFAKIDPYLTQEKIAQSRPLVFSQSAEIFETPAAELHSVYQIANKAYISQGRKSLKRIRRTVDALSMEAMYTSVRSELASWNEFLSVLEMSLFADPK
ncbi:MAG: hypothetical protein ACRCWJ_08255 [Casimicrobium sp.]